MGTQLGNVIEREDKGGKLSHFFQCARTMKRLRHQQKHVLGVAAWFG